MFCNNFVYFQVFCIFPKNFAVLKCYRVINELPPLTLLVDQEQNCKSKCISTTKSVKVHLNLNVHLNVNIFGAGPFWREV